MFSCIANWSSLCRYSSQTCVITAYVLLTVCYLSKLKAPRLSGKKTKLHFEQEYDGEQVLFVSYGVVGLFLQPAGEDKEGTEMIRMEECSICGGKFPTPAKKWQTKLKLGITL